MQKKLLTTLLFLASLLFSATGTAEELHIRIDSDATATGIRVLVAPFGPLAKIIEADLQRSGRFALIDPARAGQSLKPGQPLDAATLQTAGAQYVVLGDHAGSLNLEIVNVDDGKRIGSYRIPPHPNQRRMAHKAADLAFEKLTGIKGAFDTRIAYIAASGPPKRQVYQLIVSDADGFNPRTIVSSHKPVMSPNWSPNGRQLAYVSYETGRPVVYVQDLASGSKRAISDPKRSSISPSWSPDGRSIAMSVSNRGDYDIYVASSQGGGLRQVTRARGIDAEPEWANNNTLIFTSDRGGQPQLYQTSVTGGSEKRVSFNGSYNAGASIAGNKLAMVRRNGGNFRITVMDAVTRDEMTVSRGSLDESPALAPNGTMVLYATEAGGRGSLAVASDNGKAHQILSSQAGDVRDPAWSPFLN